MGKIRIKVEHYPEWRREVVPDLFQLGPCPQCKEDRLIVSVLEHGFVKATCSCSGLRKISEPDFQGIAVRIPCPICENEDMDARKVPGASNAENYGFECAQGHYVWVSDLALDHKEL